MRQWTIPSRGTARFTFLLFEQFSNHVFANALEPLRAANTFLRTRAYDWRIVTLDGRPVASSAGMRVVPDGAFGDTGHGTALVLLPSYGYRAFATPDLSRRLRAAARRHEMLIGLDGGAWLLAAAGLLDGRPATIHFDEIDAFAETFPEVDARRERYVDDGDRLTAAGALTAFELMSHLVARAHGTALTLRIAALFALPDAAAPAPFGPPGGDRRVRAALSLMTEHVETPLPLTAIAERLGTSQKDLERRFSRAFGAAPRTVYRRIRLDAARNLLETSALSVSEIAARAGYDNASAFTRAFREVFGTTPLRLRSS